MGMKTVSYTDQLALDALSKQLDIYRVEFPDDALAALADRIDIPAVGYLKGSLGFAYRNGIVQVRGEFTAEVEQICVVSLEPFKTEIAEEIELDLVSAEEAEAREEAGALWDPDEPEFDVLEGDFVVPGEILAQTLSLALDDHPRKADALLSTDGAAVEVNEAPLKKENPFAALKGLVSEKSDKT